MSLESKIKLSDPHGYYGTPFRYWIAVHLPKLIKSICKNNNASILDLGCGQGQYAKLFQSLKINGEYLGVDLNSKANWNKIKSTDKLKVELREHDAEKLSLLTKTFDFIFAVTTFEHFDDQIAVINGAFNVSEENGKILIIIPSHYSYLCYGTHGYRRYSKSSLQKLVSDAGFTLIKTRKINGLFSFLFHFFWRNTTFIIKRFLKAIYYSCFMGNKKLARNKLPYLASIIDDLMHLHLKTKVGRFLHKSIILITYKIDKLIPFFEIGYFCIAMKEGKNHRKN